MPFRISVRHEYIYITLANVVILQHSRTKSLSTLTKSCTYSFVEVRYFYSCVSMSKLTLYESPNTRLLTCYLACSLLLIIRASGASIYSCTQVSLAFR